MSGDLGRGIVSSEPLVGATLKNLEEANRHGRLTRSNGHQIRPLVHVDPRSPRNRAERRAVERDARRHAKARQRGDGR